MRNPQFKTKKLGDLTSAVNLGNLYYLCKQTQQGNKEVVDAFFLVKPVSATFEAAPEMTQEGVQLDFGQSVPETVLEQIAEVTNPDNMTQEGVQPDFQFGQSAPETVLEQVAEATNSNNMTQEGVDLAATFEKGSSEQTNNVAEQMQQATQGMTAQGFKKEGFTKPLGT